MSTVPVGDEAKEVFFPPPPFLLKGHHDIVFSLSTRLD